MNRSAGHTAWSLTRSPDGGFALEAAGKTRIRGVPHGEGWRIEGLEERILERGERGFVVRVEENGEEIARTMPFVGAGRRSGTRFLIQADARMFRIVQRGPRDPGYDLLGWEVPGAYLSARPESQGWTLMPTAAATGLDDLRLLALLFAAEILEDEGPRQAW